MGKISSNLFLKYGYSLILIDANLQKLQDLKFQLIRTFLHQFENDYHERIKIMQFDLCTGKDSTSIEHYVRKTIDVDKMDIPIIVNTSGYGGYW